MIGPKSQNSVEGSQNVAQAGRDFHGIPPAEHRAMMEKLLARHEAELASVRKDLEDKHKESRRADDAELRMQRMQIERLTEQVAALQTKLQNPEASYQEDMVRISDLEKRLDREANHFGAERIEEAKKALQNLDYSKAEALFQEVEAEAQIAVDAAARAAYGLGEIAEARVDWAKAAEHYVRAANMSLDFDRLSKALDLNERAARYETAYFYGSQLVDLARNGETQERLAFALNAHATTLRAMGRYDEAETLYRQALKIAKATIGATHPDYANGLNNLAGLLKDMGRYAEAEPLYRKVLAIDKLTPDDPHLDHAKHLNNFGDLLEYMGRCAEAEPLYRQALNIVEATDLKKHPYYAVTLINLAGVLKKNHGYTESEPLYWQALEIDKVTIGEMHPNYATHISNLACLMLEMARYTEAEPLFKQALTITKTTLGEAHKNYARDLRTLAILYARTDRFPEAEPLMAEALSIIEFALPADHPYIEGTRQSLAKIRAKLSDQP